MRQFAVPVATLFVLIQLLASVGCGGDADGDRPAPAVTLTASADGTVSLAGSADALPTGVSAAQITLTPKAVADVPAAPAWASYVAAVECGPSGTAFSQPVSLVFKLSPSRTPNERLSLLLLQDGGWTATGGDATVDASGNSATAKVTHFSTMGLFVPQKVTLSGNLSFSFGNGLMGGFTYMDTTQTLLMPHAAALELTKAYDTTKVAPYGQYRDSNGPTPGNFPASAGKAYVLRASPISPGKFTYFKMLIVSATSGSGSAFTFWIEQILPPDIVDAAGEWTFPGGAHLSVFPGGLSMDLTPSAGASVIVIHGDYTNKTTLVGDWADTGGSGAKGTVTATLSMNLGGPLSATFAGSPGLGTVSLSGGSKL